MDALLARVGNAFPTAPEVSRITKNARNYQNDIVSVIAPYLARAHWFHLRIYMPPKPARGKNLADANLVIAMRHINKYISETKSDVLTPSNLVSVIQRDGRGRISTPELIFVRRNGPGLKAWLRGFSSKPKALAKICKVSEGRYGIVSNDIVEATTFPYSRGVGNNLVFGIGISPKLSQRAASVSESNSDGSSFPNLNQPMGLNR